jgi:membrane associated rhomboid family serine protease
MNGSGWRTPGSGVQLVVPPVTPMIKSILIACGGAFVLQLLAGLEVVRIFGLSPQLATTHFFLWQYFTYLFLHGDISHLLFNLLGLWMFGGDVEQRMGSREFLRFYLLCGAGAGVVWVGVSWLAGTSGITIGASGAIFGVLTAFAVMFPERIILVMLIFPMRARTAALLFAGIELLASWGYAGSGVNRVAHLAGMAIAYIYLRRYTLGLQLRGLLGRRRSRPFTIYRGGSGWKSDQDDRWLH